MLVTWSRIREDRIKIILSYNENKVVAVFPEHKLTLKHLSVLLDGSEIRGRNAEKQILSHIIECIKTGNDKKTYVRDSTGRTINIEILWLGRPVHFSYHNDNATMSISQVVSYVMDKTKHDWSITKTGTDYTIVIDNGVRKSEIVYSIIGNCHISMYICGSKVGHNTYQPKDIACGIKEIVFWNNQ